jgi:hypothetical protein
MESYVRDYQSHEELAIKLAVDPVDHPNHPDHFDHFDHSITMSAARTLSIDLDANKHQNPDWVVDDEIPSEMLSLQEFVAPSAPDFNHPKHHFI